MDAKEIKSALKSVKEFLEMKEFESVVKMCKNILRSDRNNYYALVFFGAGLQETGEREAAPKAFKKAIEISPEQVLAWRGLASYYEKFSPEANKMDLLKIYKKLLTLEPDISKCNDIYKKLEKLTVENCDNDCINFIFNEICYVNNIQEKQMWEKLLMSTISDVKYIPVEHLISFEEILERMIKYEPKSDDHIELYKRYLKTLHRRKKSHKLVEEAITFHQLYSDDVYPLEWICKIYSEAILEGSKELIEPGQIKDIYTMLLSKSPDSYLALLCKGVYEINSSDWLSGRDTLQRVVNSQTSSVLGWVLLCQCQIELYNFVESEYSAKQALNYLDQTLLKETYLKCNLWLIRSYLEQNTLEKIKEGLELCSQFFHTNQEIPEVIYLMIKAFIMSHDYQKARKYLNEFQNISAVSKSLLLSHLSLSEGNQNESLVILKSVIKEEPSTYEAYLELGKIQFLKNEITECLMTFLKGTKLNPFCFWNFVYLGHCYKNMNDLDKARRCYQKAFQLNPRSSDAGIGLSDVYRCLGKENLNMELLSIATQVPGTKWAWLRLGLHYLAINKLEDAIQSLKVAVRIDPNDQYCWESLADAYLSRGAYTSALKSYERATQLDSSLVYPFLQIAIVKHLIGNFEESVLEFRNIIKLNPLYIPALKGHAEACFSSMKNFLKMQLNGLALDRCQEAVDSLCKGLEQRKDLNCMWKLLGDCCTVISSLPEKYSVLYIPSWLLQSSNKNENSTAEFHYNKIKKGDIMKLSSKCYYYALSIIDNSSLWYDLAVSYNLQADAESLQENRKYKRELAFSSVKKSLLMNDKCCEAWNLFGLIAASKEISDMQLSQHAFIKAIMELDTNPVTWSNLGTLYLNLGDLKLANQAFTEAQKCDPDYVQCWIGQAIIAELTGHHDAMDLFRHSTQLGIHSEGCLGYANMVCSTLLNTTDKSDKNYLYNIKNMNAITVASDAMIWYTDRIKGNACAFNMLGLLLERQKLYRKSAEAYSKALKLLLKLSITEKNESDRIDQIRLNYGRVLLKLNLYDETLAQFKSIQKANFVNQCGLASAYFKIGKYEESYDTYQTTLEWLAPDDSFKSHILVAMAAVVYMFQGQDDAKLLLVQASQLKPPSVHGLFACCALGMLHSNLPLSELALKELSCRKDDIQYLHHIAVFQAYIHLLKGENKEAVRTLSKVTHRHPSQPQLWLALSLLLLQLYPSFDSSSAAVAATVAMTSGRGSIDVSKMMSLVSMSYLLSGAGLKSLRSSQKAVHMYPDVTENWAVLIASVVARCIGKPTVKEILWLKKIITYVRRKLEASKQITNWLSSYERKVTILADQILNRNK